MSTLDSLAKLYMNRGDYVSHPCGHLNCPLHEFDDSNTRPIEGEEYEQIVGFEWKNEGKRIYTIKGYETVVYKYPDLTNEQLLEKFNLVRIKGYYPKKKFYYPVYDAVSRFEGFPDYRNTLYWKSDILTNENGEATITFYCSDINTKFMGSIEGVSDEGLLGRQNFEFNVRKVFIIL